MTRIPLLMITLALLFISAQSACAASVTVTSVSSGNYIIQGDAMDGVAGIDLTLIYDSSSLALPTVSQGSLVAGALMSANTNNPGSIKIAIISTKAFSGSGQIAAVTFSTRNGTGGITSASVHMINSQGSPISALVSVSGGDAAAAATPGFITTPGIPFSQPGSTTTTSSGTTATVSSVTATVGTVSIPADPQPGIDTKPADKAVVPDLVAEPAATIPVDPPAEVKPAAEPLKSEIVKVTSYTGALDLFRTYRGEKTPAILVALITKEISPAIRQEPPVALSDGKTPLNIRVKFTAAADRSPNFSLNGAKLVSLNRDISNAWFIEALPQAGTVKASLTILTDSEMIEYPLTLAPPVEGVSPVEAGFAVFLADSGAAKPKRDLNGDGIHDYLDDFIYTANYLKKKGAAGTARKSETVQTVAIPVPTHASSPKVTMPAQKDMSYTLSAGATVNRSRLDLLLKKLKAAGLQPVVREENKTMDVYRLVAGCFSGKSAAQKRLNALAHREKQAFIVHDTEQYCVIVASFFSFEAAGTEQNSYAKKGLPTDLVKVRVPQTSWQVTIGSYNDSQSATSEAKRLEERGIVVSVVPRGK